MNHQGSHGLKIRGIEIRLHPSLLFLLGYLVLVIAVQFPFVTRQAGVDPASLAWGENGAIPWGIILAVSLLVSVLLHELGHALLAISLGVRVKSITLMMLGGVSAIEKTPEEPYFELKLSAAGPLVSFGLAALLYWIRVESHVPNLVFFCHWLGRANLVLGIFNLLPAFPLDGGRVLRSLLAVRQGVTRATANAVRVSHFFAMLMAIAGILTFNILLMLVAYVIYIGAQSEATIQTSRMALKGLFARELVIRTEPLDESLWLSQAASKMLAQRQSVLPVRRENGEPALLGITRMLSVPRPLWPQTRVTEVLQASPKFVDVNEPMEQVFPELAGAPNAALPVAEDGRIIGIIRLSDLSEFVTLKTLEREQGGQQAA